MCAGVRAPGPDGREKKKKGGGGARFVRRPEAPLPTCSFLFLLRTMPLLPYVFKGFIFDEPAMGKPHPPRPWGSRLDVAKRFVPPLNDPAAPPPPGITLTLSTTDATVREAAACLARGGSTAALDGRLPQDLLVTATAEGEGVSERERGKGERGRAARARFALAPTPPLSCLSPFSL